MKDFHAKLSEAKLVINKKNNYVLCSRLQKYIFSLARVHYYLVSMQSIWNKNAGGNRSSFVEHLLASTFSHRLRGWLISPNDETAGSHLQEAASSLSGQISF